MLPLDHVLPTPSIDSLSRQCFADIYHPAEDSYLFLDALEKDSDFIRKWVKPVLSIEIGSGSGIISTFLSKLIDRTCSFLCIDISNQVWIFHKQIF